MTVSEQWSSRRGTAVTRPVQLPAAGHFTYASQWWHDPPDPQLTMPTTVQWPSPAAVASLDHR